MASQASAVGFGSDITVLAGYAQYGNERLGNVDIQFENIGTNPATILIKKYDSEKSGYNVTVGPVITVAPAGTVTKSYAGILAQRLGFFGSGDTEVNITPTFRNPANLRGAQIDVLIGGRRGFGFDVAYDKAAFRPNWGPQPDGANIPLDGGGEYAGS